MKTPAIGNAANSTTAAVCASFGTPGTNPTKNSRNSVAAPHSIDTRNARAFPARRASGAKITMPAITPRMISAVIADVNTPSSSAPLNPNASTSPSTAAT